MSEHAPMVWVDVETTGLNPDWDQLLEIAVLVTDDNLDPFAGYESVVHWPELVTMPPPVLEMHERSGLRTEVLHGGKLLPLIQLEIVELLDRCGVLPGKSPLCGSTVHFDRGFLKRDLPEVEAMLHYRNVDISSLKELIARWRPELLWFKKGVHRAMPDIHDSIKELRAYRGALGL